MVLARRPNLIHAREQLHVVGARLSASERAEGRQVVIVREYVPTSAVELQSEAQQLGLK